MQTDRNRGWRLAQKRHRRSRDVHAAPPRSCGVKKWKHLYLREEKLKRAVQLGIEYPRLSNQQLARRGMEEYQLVDECPFHMQS